MRIDIDAGARDQRNAVAGTPRRSISARSSRFCTSTAERERLSSRRNSSVKAVRAVRTFSRIADENRAEAGHSVETNDRKTGGGERSDHGGLARRRDERDRARACGRACAPRARRERGRAGSRAAAAPGDGMEMKPFGLDGGAMAVDAGRDVHVEARVASGARHRQAMRHEVPVLGHEIDDARRLPRRALCGQGVASRQELRLTIPRPRQRYDRGWLRVPVRK